MCRIEFGWWQYKIKCEIGYHLFGSTSKMYNKNLDKMLSKYNRNLYGKNMHEVKLSITHCVWHRFLTKQIDYELSKTSKKQRNK